MSSISLRTSVIVRGHGRATRWARLPASGLASRATTRSPRIIAKVLPSARVIVVLPTPPFRLMTTTRRDPLIGAVTRSSTAARFRSVALRPGFIAPDVAPYTARRQPWTGTGPFLGLSIASSVKAAAVSASRGRVGSRGGSGSAFDSDELADSAARRISDAISTPVGAAGTWCDSLLTALFDRARRLATGRAI